MQSQEKERSVNWGNRAIFSVFVFVRMFLPGVDSESTGWKHGAVTFCRRNVCHEVIDHAKKNLNRKIEKKSQIYYLHPIFYLKNKRSRLKRHLFLFINWSSIRFVKSVSSQQLSSTDQGIPLISLGKITHVLGHYL